MLVACLISLQHVSVSQGQICSDNATCCHTEIGIAHQTFYLTQSQYTDTKPTSLSTDLTTPAAWLGSQCSATYKVTGMIQPRKKPCKRKSKPQSFWLSKQIPPKTKTKTKTNSIHTNIADNVLGSKVELTQHVKSSAAQLANHPRN